ncbi:hypothetical protein AM499_17420 [Bacillus sp. FJAT-22090]|uniref:hypothetical protein n=1 Tax=Bacillus sp. FJAT-22090 TaxID=1581038 RepID=UPI0006AFA742|nr:hypothetical protein [Bacillus sp. FJAT-22090]ALC87395.1 hypothetical protein AM499_17420 [Bacillus sp. FJAT-22090]
MNNNDPKQQMINDQVNVTRTIVILAKKYILQLNTTHIDIANELPKFLSLHGYSDPGVVNVHDSIFDEKQITKVAGYLSYSIAFSEAILELIHSNYLIATSKQQYPYNSSGYTISWTTVIQGYGGTNSSWNFNHLITEIPSKVKRALSIKNENFVLFDADMYITELNLNNAHIEVIEALRDTIDCFKNELYRPSLTMLGKVVEGAWIETGISLANFAIKQNNDKEKNEVLIEYLQGPDGFNKKVEKIVNLYSSHHKDWFIDLRKKSGIQISHLVEIRIWTDVVREARNAIHFGAIPTTPNTFEKASTLLLAGSKNLKTLYNLKLEADK